MQPVSLVIPVYNNWELTRDCLLSLRACPPGTALEVLVVDNASQDATRTELEPLGRELFGEGFRALVNPENRNFAGAANQGAWAARYPHVFFLNNDTRLTPGWYAPLSSRLENEPDLGGVGPLLAFEDESVQHLGAAVYPDRGLGHFYAGIPISHALARKRRRLRYCTAAALLMRRDQFLEMGGFYEGFVNGLEDVDLCWRLGRAGYALSVEPTALVYHLESRSRGLGRGGSDNVPLLDARCPDLRRPEFHHIALADGYEPYLGLFFETFLRPETGRRRRYAELADRADAAALRAVLKRELYWQEGWHALAGIRERDEGPEAALETLLEGCALIPSLESVARVAECAARAGRAEVAAEYGALLGEARRLAGDRAFLQRKFDRLLETARDLDDTGLLRLLRLWHAAYGAALGVAASDSRRS